MNKINYKIRQVIIGEYVAMPIKNAFNNKTSYWLSKKDCMLSIYMFTVENCFGIKDFEDRLKIDSIKPYIVMLEEQCKRELNNEVYREEMDKINTLFNKTI